MERDACILCMEGLNQTVTEFIFIGLTNDFKLQVLLFVIFTLVYIFTVLGNSGIIALICTDPQFNTPMYFFLSNLSFVDLMCSSSVTPKMLATVLSDRKTISFSGCAAQLYFFSVFAGSGVCLLGVMAYDRYVAICKPLHYQVIITQKTCACLVCTTYCMCFLNSSVHGYLTFTLTFCGFNVIDDFFCDYPPLVKLACSDTSTNEIAILGSTVIFVMGTFVMIVTSYWFIVSTILRIPTVTGRHKAFSTCISHFSVVSLYYGTAFVMYFQPISNSSAQSKVLSLFYTVVIPMLNPMIYSLRNKEVKISLNKQHQQICKRLGIHCKHSTVGIPLNGP